MLVRIVAAALAHAFFTRAAGSQHVRDQSGPVPCAAPARMSVRSRIPGSGSGFGARMAAWTT